jgi:hypothetical protein
MNWDALGAIGEIVGSAAVVLTLAYLAIQTKNSSQVARSNSTNQSRTALTEIMIMIASDSETSEVYYTGMTNPTSLSAEQRVRFDILIYLQVRGTETIFLEHKNKLISEELWLAQWRGQKKILGSPGGLESWRRQQEIVTPQFKDFVNANLETDKKTT